MSNNNLVVRNLYLDLHPTLNIRTTINVIITNQPLGIRFQEVVSKLL